MIWFILVAAIFFFINEYVESSEHSLAVSDGTNVATGSHPYMALIYLNNRTMGGGSILNERFIITAAHCVRRPLEGNNYTVRVGSLYRLEGGIEYPVSAIYMYDSYNRTECYGDIALVKLPVYLDYSDTIKAIALAYSGMDIPDGINATALGYGQISPKGPWAPQLQLVYLKIINKEKCGNLLEREIYSGQLCVGDLSGTYDTCPGDAGGPLIYNNTLIGITACSRKPCKTPNTPGIYTDVRTFSLFIRWTMLIHA